MLFFRVCVSHGHSSCIVCNQFFSLSLFLSMLDFCMFAKRPHSVPIYIGCVRIYFFLLALFFLLFALLCLLLLPAALCVMPSYVLFRRLSGAEVYSITVVLTTNARPGIVATNTCSKYTQWQNRAGCERDNRTENKYHFPKVTN